MPSPLQDLHQQKNFLFFLSHVSGAYSQKKTLKLLRVKPCSISNLKNIFWTPCLTIINVTGFCVPTVIFAFRISCYSVIFWPYFSVLLFIISMSKYFSSCFFLKLKNQSVPLKLLPVVFPPRHCHAPDAYQLVFVCIVSATYCAPGQVVYNSFTLITWPARTSVRVLKIMSSMPS